VEPRKEGGVCEREERGEERGRRRRRRRERSMRGKGEKVCWK